MKTNGEPVDTGAMARRHDVPACKTKAVHPARSRAAARARRQGRGCRAGSRGNCAGLVGPGGSESGLECFEGVA